MKEEGRMYVSVRVYIHIHAHAVHADEGKEEEHSQIR